MSALMVMSGEHPEPDVVSCGAGMKDGRGRVVRYLRMSVTDRCDMACIYCMPLGYTGSPRQEILTFEEMVRVVRAFHAVGVTTVRLTGGEPLVRKGVVDLCRAITTQVPGMDVALTTNGRLLDRLAMPLREAGLSRINVSLDSLDPATFARITRVGDLGAVLRGLEVAREVGFTEIKTNTVVMRRHNLGEVATLARWVVERGMTPRFIELMPLGQGAEMMDQRVGWEEMRACMADVLEEAEPQRQARRGPAFYLPTRLGGRVGFITAVSHGFCERCDRVRLTSKGEIRACLASPDGMNVRDLLRRGVKDAELAALLAKALGSKAEHAFSEIGHGSAPLVSMTGVGG